MGTTVQVEAENRSRQERNLASLALPVLAPDLVAELEVLSLFPLNTTRSLCIEWRVVLSRVPLLNTICFVFTCLLPATSSMSLCLCVCAFVLLELYAHCIVPS